MNMSNFGGNMQLEGRDLITITDINTQVSGNYNPDAVLLSFALPSHYDYICGNHPYRSL